MDRWAAVAAFVLAALLLGATTWRGIERPDWRDADLATIARNFHREGMNPLYPRIDWRGDGPGYTEMELPLLPWTMAALYPLFGERPAIGRALGAASSLLALLFVIALARTRLGPLGAAAAGLWYAVHPLLTLTGTMLRPESAMLLCYVAAVHFFTRWLREERPRDYALALGATALALLAKLTALHLGLLFAALVLRERGSAAWRDRRLWIFAASCLLPAALWYLHARGLWLEYGHSMGLSNQDHFFATDVLRDGRSLPGVLDTERRQVFTWGGAALVGLGAAAGAWRRWLGLELWWAGALALYYGLTAATTGESWAVHYHVVSVPLSALLVGGSIEALWRRGPWLRVLGAAVLAVALVMAGTRSVETVARLRRTGQEPHPHRVCAEKLAAHLPAEGLIAVSGAACRDESGRRTSHNRPYYFYWMDRKGFQPCREDLTAETLAALAGRGAGYLVAEREDLRHARGLAAKLRGEGRVVSECETAVLFRLTP